MKKFVWLGALGLIAALGLCAPAKAQVCAGDCNGNNMVAVNEVITCVNIELELAQLSTCTACDPHNNGVVAISDLIAAVNVALGTTTCGGGNGPKCGNGTKEAPEECDDGNNFGGDGCAANCTTEDARVGTFDSDKTVATVQTESFPITLHLTGSQTFRTGHARPDVTLDKNGNQIYAVGEIPVVIKATELNFDPVKVQGLVCACVKGVPVESFGPGNSAMGSIGCGSQGLTDISYRLVQDHSTLPGDATNKVMGTPNDPECNDTAVLPGGTTSTACKEGVDLLCAGHCSTTTTQACSKNADCPASETCIGADAHPHTGVCNGPRTLTRFGGVEQPGSAFVLNNTSISLLADAGTCDTSGHMVGGKCPFPDYGPDCLPCTDDDLVQTPPNNIPTTTATAEAAVFDANLDNGAIIDKDQSCFGAPCQTVFQGKNFDCTLFTPGSSGGLSGGSLVVAFPSLDAAQIGDNTTGTVFSNQ
jgi:cysteine-rich repeat protein